MDANDVERNTAVSWTGDLFPFNTWLESIERSTVTGWRWRERGWINVINIAGRLYVSRGEVARFEARASRGEFRQTHKTPAQIRENS